MRDNVFVLVNPSLFASCVVIAIIDMWIGRSDASSRQMADPAGFHVLFVCVFVFRSIQVCLQVVFTQFVL
jgi:hypothetical protein